LYLKAVPRITQAIAAFIILLALLTASEYLFGWDLGIDQWVVRDQISIADTRFPGRMSLTSVLNLCLIGIALLLSSRFRRQGVAQALAFVVGCLGLLSLAGYLYDVQSLYQIGQLSSIALHTSITFIVLGAGIFFAFQIAV
jgi:hypothetical protein